MSFDNTKLLTVYYNMELSLWQGILFVDTTVVGWKPVAKAWLEDRTQQEVHVSEQWKHLKPPYYVHLLDLQHIIC